MSSESDDLPERLSASPTPEQQLKTAMQLADVICRHEAATRPTDVQSDNFALSWLRNSLEAPGVVHGCGVAAVCLCVLLPARRHFLRIADQQLKLGATFPDLIATAAVAVTTAQCSLWAGSVYGSAAYLERLADIPSTTASQTVDAICNDAAVTAVLESRLDTSTIRHADEDGSGWDPRVKTVAALQRALKACRERRLHQAREAESVSAPSSSFDNNQKMVEIANQLYILYYSHLYPSIVNEGV